MAIALSQFVTATVNLGSSVSAVFSSAVTAGNSLMLVVGFWSDASHTVPSTVNDAVNTAGFTQRVFSTMASDTNAHLRIYDKLNISSGRGASTYRVNSSVTGTMSISWCAMEFSGGPITFASTASAGGTSTGPQAGALTASSTPGLFLSGAIVNSTTLFNSTVGAGGPHAWVATVDPTNAAQITNIIYSVNSSLQQNPMHSMNGSTRWSAGTVLYLGLGGAAAAGPSPWAMCMTGIQDKVF